MKIKPFVSIPYNTYVTGDGVAVPRLGPGRGLAVYTPAPFNYTNRACAFAFNKPEHQVVCHLKLGWNLIGTPGVNIVPWNSAKFRVRRPDTNNSTYGQVYAGNDSSPDGPYNESLDAAFAQNLIDNFAWDYNRTSHITQMVPGIAYWIYVRSPLDLELLLSNS